MAAWINQSAVQLKRNVNFNVIDKNVHGPKITKAETISRLAIEKELIKLKEPSAATYNLD